MTTTRRRLLRSGLRAISVGSIVLALAIAVLWPISYRTAYAPFLCNLAVGVLQGSVYAIYNTEGLPTWPPGLLVVPVDPREPLPETTVDFAGFGFGVDASGEGRAKLPAPVAILLLLATATTAWISAKSLHPPTANSPLTDAART